MVMNAGDMDERVEIQSLTNTINNLNEDERSWNTLTTSWMKVEELSGNELFLAQQTATGVTTRFTLWYRDDFDEKDRFVWRERNYEIIYMNPDRRKNKLVVLGRYLEANAPS